MQDIGKLLLKALTALDTTIKEKPLDPDLDRMTWYYRTQLRLALERGDQLMNHISKFGLPVPPPYPAEEYEAQYVNFKEPLNDDELRKDWVKRYGIRYDWKGSGDAEEMKRKCGEEIERLHKRRKRALSM